MDYKNNTKEELIKICSEREIKVPRYLKKDDIIEILENADKKEEAAKAAPARAKKKVSERAKRKSSSRRSKRNRKPQNSEPEILTIDGGEGVVALTERERAERELHLSMSDANASITGTVLVVSPAQVFGQTRKEKITIVPATVIYKGVKIIIPSNYFLENWESMTPEETLKAMQNRIGSEVDFVIKNVDTGTGSAVYLGDRITAMKKKREKFWYGKKRGRDSHMYRINEGDVVEARVVAVSTNYVTVEAFGAETYIHLTELAYEYLSDARTRFSVGDRVNVKVMAVEREPLSENEENFPIRFAASVKATMRDPREVHYGEYAPNQTCLGTVTKYVPGGTAPRFFVNVAGEIDVLCWMKEGVTMLPEEGDTVSIKLARMYDESKRFTGTITHVDVRRR